MTTTTTTTTNDNNICCSFETSIVDTNSCGSSYNYYYRRAIAPKNLKPGDIVNIEKPFAFQILKEYSSEYCSYCLTKFSSSSSSSSSSSGGNIIKKGKGKRCLGGCQYTYYCNRQCQIADFHIHKYTCKEYNKIMKEALQGNYYPQQGQQGQGKELFFNYEDFMLARNVYMQLCLLESSGNKKKNVNFNDIPTPQLPPNIDSLVPSSSLSANNKVVDDTANQHPDERILAMAIAKSFNIIQQQQNDDDDNDDGIIINFFHRLLQKFRLNNFGIQNSLQTVIASGVYPIGAILNHSCNPNCILTYNDDHHGGGTQIIRVIKSISKGEELFHSYTDICQPTSVRQQRLQQIHNFKCNCERCQPTGDMWINLEKELIKGNTNLNINESKKMYNLQLQAQQLSMADTDDDNDDALLMKEYGILQQILDLQYNKLGRYNLEVYKTECQALNVAMILDNSSNSSSSSGVDVLKHAEATVNFLKFVLCSDGKGYHPLLLLQQMTLSELYESKGKIDIATRMYQELIDKSAIVFGPDHDFVHHYKALLSQANKIPI